MAYLGCPVAPPCLAQCLVQQGLSIFNWVISTPPHHHASTSDSISTAIKNFKLQLKINWKPWVVYVSLTSVTSGLEEVGCGGGKKGR